jgi:hypothetical protein
MVTVPPKSQTDAGAASHRTHFSSKVIIPVSPQRLTSKTRSELVSLHPFPLFRCSCRRYSAPTSARLHAPLTHVSVTLTQSEQLQCPD